MFSVLKKRAAHTKCDLWVWDVFPTSRCRNWRRSGSGHCANLQNLYVQALLARYQNRKGLHCQIEKDGRQCTACQVLKSWQSRTLTPKTVNVFWVD